MDFRISLYIERGCNTNGVFGSGGNLSYREGRFSPFSLFGERGKNSSWRCPGGCIAEREREKKIKFGATPSLARTLRSLKCSLGKGSVWRLTLRNPAIIEESLLLVLVFRKDSELNFLTFLNEFYEAGEPSRSIHQFDEGLKIQSTYEDLGRQVTEPLKSAKTQEKWSSPASSFLSYQAYRSMNNINYL